MQDAAGRARDALAEKAPAALAFLQTRHNPDGGFAGRDRKTDLYYTVFGAEGVLALGGDLDLARLQRLLDLFEGGDSLDLVHLACLVRCWADIEEADLAASLPAAYRKRMIRRIEQHRRADGGYAQSPDGTVGTAYGSFLAVGAYQDLRETLPDPSDLIACLDALKVHAGAFANEQRLPLGATPTTAAAAVVLCELGADVPPEALRWLRDRRCEDGGFAALPGAPGSDLLSTATALHALARAGDDLADLRPTVEPFVRSLQGGHGGFRSTPGERDADCEYTYYALLALGHLAAGAETAHDA